MRPPQIRIRHELVADNFAGGGGASTGIEAAIGRPVDIAINHDPQAIEMHRRNHPETKHYLEDVWRVDPIQACQGRPVGLAWFSPDCFPAGTMVLTDRGYVAIELVQVGDTVLTHRQRWRKVTGTHQTSKQLLEIRGHGHYGLRVSAEHPFYARKRRTLHLGHAFDEPAWTTAWELRRDWYWATPTTVPSLPIPVLVGSAKGTVLPVDERLLWLAGRYVGDGWTRLTDTRAELVIICGKHEAATLAPLLDAWPRSGERVRTGELAWYQRETRTSAQFTANSRALVEWLRSNFRHGAGAKTVPAWLLGAPEELRLAFLNGYLSADGHAHDDAKGKPMVEATTVSSSLVWGMRTLLATLGIGATVYRVANQSNVIEGRQVRVRTAYSIRWRRSIEASHAQTFVDYGVRWSPIRESSRLEGEHVVYNIAVDEDESYVADGIVVHNCTHFSRAKGSAPVSKRVRGLAWVVIRWAAAVRPRVIVLENVEEFQTWGPVVGSRPDPARAGQTFRAWTRKLRSLGYQVEFRTLVAADYGAPTTRRRLFMVARCDGAPIRWPEPTHGQGRAPWHPAASIIDWSIPCPSIFDRRRPLAEATLRRIAAGIRRYVVDSPEPFIVPLTHQGDARVHGIGEPVRTVTGAHRGELALINPFVVRHGHYSTITGAGLEEGRGCGTFRGQPLGAPLATVCATNDKHLVVPHITKFYGNGVIGHKVDRPLGTVTAWDHHGLVAAFLSKFYGTSIGSDMCAPVPTVTASGKGGGHLGEVRAFLVKYHGGERQRVLPLDEPLRTIDTANRFGLITVHGEPYEIVDIGMRMLQPRELFNAQGFPVDYQIDGMTKTAQIALCGNSVCPPVARAIVEANVAAQRAEVA